MVDFVTHIQKLKRMEAYEVIQYTQEKSVFLQDYNALSNTEKSHYLPMLVQEAPSILSLLPACVSRDVVPFVTCMDEQKNIYASWILEDIHLFDKIPPKIVEHYRDIFIRLLSSHSQLKYSEDVQYYLNHHCQHQSFKELFANNWWEDNPNLYHVFSEKDGLCFFVYRMRYENDVDIPDTVLHEVLNHLRDIDMDLPMKWMHQYCDNLYRNLDRYVMSHTITPDAPPACQLLAFLKKGDGDPKIEKISWVDKWVVYNTLQKDPVWQSILPEKLPGDLDEWYKSILHAPTTESELHF